MYIQLKDDTYIAASGIVRHNGRHVDYRSGDGELTRAELTPHGYHALEIWSKKFIEVSDKHDNTAIIPIEKINSIRRLGPQRQFCSVDTTSGETFYLSDDLFKKLIGITLMGDEYPKVP